MKLLLKTCHNLNMAKFVWTIVVFLIMVNVTTSLNIFHEGSKVTYRPETSAEMFGFCVVLNPYGLIVGAPKASHPKNPAMKPGGVFNCSTQDLDVREVTCQLMAPASEQKNRASWFGRTIPNDFFKDDMWFGANIVFLSNGKLLINAPRWTTPYGTKHLLANGISYLRTQKRDWILHLLKDSNRQAYVTNGNRREYGEYGTHLNNYAYGQAGMSSKVTEANTVIIGAPGLLQWTGGIVSVAFDPDENNMFLKKQPIANTYFTKDLGPDDYFGYAVESGIFERSGRVLYVGGAPRSKLGYGQVLVFVPMTDEGALNILAKLQGPQLGAYFGASLCSTDLNGDGLDDLLVGAPMYVTKDGGLPHDQGAVFIYLTHEEPSSFTLRESGHLTGSEIDAARFGTTIADLGDIDGDGYADIAIGAPWENGKGVVYIYRGCAQGLKKEYAQKIESEDAKGFGISISKGLDIDRNNCTDLAIGAYASESVYLYRSVLTMQVNASIRVPDALNLPQNATGFTAIFCVGATPRQFWPHVEINLIGRITVDPEGNRAMLSGDSEYRIKVKPSQDLCDDQNVEVWATADLSKPISIIFELASVEVIKDNDTHYPTNAVRLSEDSKLKTSFLIQLVRDCGEDMVCTPWLVMDLEPLDNPYIPGSSSRLGVKIAITNKEEPAYGAKVNIILPFQPIRVPSECSLMASNMTCDVPSPLNRNQDIVWEIEMEYHLNETEDLSYNVTAILSDPLYRNVSEDAVKVLVMEVNPVASFNVSGKPLPNGTLIITRDKFNAAENVTFKHYIEIRNHGPSDWSPLVAEINFSDKMDLSSDIKGCNNSTGSIWCEWSVPANVSIVVVIPLRFDLGEHGVLLEKNTTYNATTNILLHQKNNFTVTKITTTLTLEPAKIIWPIIAGSVVAGLFLLALIIYGFKKLGFFMRNKREEMKNLQNASANQESSSSLPVSLGDESTTELLNRDSDSE